MTDAHLNRSITGSQAYETGAEAYRGVLRDILTEGVQAKAREMQTLELSDAVIYIEDSTKAVPLGVRPGINMMIGATEYAQLLAGVSFLEQLDAASGSRFSQFSDNGRLMGAYGPRVREQLPAVAKILSQDPGSRQAIVMINHGSHDDRETHDVPCTLSLQFKIRDSKLNMTVVMRSSDAWLGIPYDWWQFSRLQMTMAWALDCEPGSFTFFAGSLHLYERNLPAAEQALKAPVNDNASLAQPPAITAGSTPFRLSNADARVMAARSVATRIVMDYDIPDASADVKFYSTLVPSVEGSWEICSTCWYVAAKGKECDHGKA